MSAMWGMCSSGSLPDHPAKAGTLQEKESQWLLGRLGKSELIQVTFANESEVKSRALSPTLGRNRRSGSSRTGKEKLRSSVYFHRTSKCPAILGPSLQCSQLREVT